MFLICGEALFDIFIHDHIAADANTIPLVARAGGSPLNVSIGLARLGREVAMLAGISTDLLGDRLVAVLESEQVSTRFIRRKPAPTTLSFVQQNSDGKPDYVFYGEGAADRCLASTDIEMSLDGIQCVHLGSYSLVVPPSADSLYQLAVKASAKRIISLDPNVRPTVEPDLQCWRDRIDSLIDLVDVIKLSDEDMSLLYPEKDPESILQRWRNRGVQLTIMTQGEAGALLISQRGDAQIEAYHIHVADSVGAGDSFQAIVLDELMALKSNYGDHWHTHLNSEHLKIIGESATIGAAITCSRSGADLPTRAELSQYKNQAADHLL